MLERRVIEERVAAATVADLSDLYRALSVEKRLAGFEVHERFYEVGSPAGLTDLERYMATES